VTSTDRAASAGRVLLPWSRSCFVCGEANPQGLRARLYLAGDVVEMDFVPRREFEGWSGVVHGGLVGTVLDEVMTWAAMLSARRAMFAAEITVRLRAPLPPGTACVARARAAAPRKSLVGVEAWLEDAAGTVYARGEGRYLPVPPERLTGFRHDFVWGEDVLGLRSAFGG
jgi:acyl-coenzyme A thioesterase PaaI-like protein